jgi:3-(3-hydroxy-phenyl)propionate hydroxylase
VLRGQAGEALVDSYHAERPAAAVENQRVTSRTARVLAPRSAAEHRIRRAVVALARHHAFARRLANTGRMAQANPYPPSPWAPSGSRSVQSARFDGTTLMRALADGSRLLGLWVGAGAADLATLRSLGGRWPFAAFAVDPSSDLACHLGVAPGTLVLVRPDGYAAAQIQGPTPALVEAALGRALSRAIDA